MFAAASYGDVDEAVAEWTTDPYAREPLMRHYVENVLVSRDDGRLVYRFDAAHLGDFARRARADRLWDALVRLDAPTLLVRGEHSELLTREVADEMIGRMKDGSLVEIPGGSHDLGVQQPEAIARSVRSFLGAEATLDGCGCILSLSWSKSTTLRSSSSSTSWAWNWSRTSRL